MTFENDFLNMCNELNGRTIKAETDMDKFAVAAVDDLKANLGVKYPDAQFRCEVSGSQVIFIGDESKSEGDGFVIEFAIGERNTLVFISKKRA